MKALLVTILLLGSLTGAQAQVGGLVDADILHREASDDPAAAVGEVNDGWFAFRYPAVEGTTMPCCWTGRQNGPMTMGCSLDGAHQGFVSNSDAGIETTLVAYARVEDGEVRRLRVAGAGCPMEADGQSVTWIGETSAVKTLDWLETLARHGDEDRVGHPALWALALHADSSATGRLRSLALEAAFDRSEQAVFWLGETRGHEGFESLDGLLSELPVGETRRQVNFALGMNSSREARDLLVRIATGDRDPDQRAEALFWLAHSYPDSALEPILEAIRGEPDPGVAEQAVFALSQLPDDVAGPALLALARDNSLPREARRQALFWLAHEGNEESLAQLVELLVN
jgi:HEAT repeat protein